MEIPPLGPANVPTPLSRPLQASGPQETFASGEPKPTLMGAARVLLNDQATERWRARLPFSLQNQPVSDPQGGLFASNGDGSVVRFDPSGGKPLWTFRAENARHFTDPAFTPEGDLLVVADMRRVYLLDRESGKKKAEIPLDEGTLSPPAPGPGNTVLLLGGDGLLTKEWSLYCVDPATPPKRSLMSRLLAPITLMPKHGTVHKWEIPVNSQPGRLPIPMTPQGDLHRIVPLDATRAAAVTGESEVTAVDARDGRLLWQKHLPAQGLFDPVRLGDHLLVAAPQQLFVLDPSTGEILRDPDAGGVVFSQPTADAQGNVYYFTGLDRLHVLRPDGTGFTHEGRFETRLPPVTDARGNLYVVKEDALYCLDAATGEENFRLAAPGQVSSSPALLPDGSLVVKIRDQNHDEQLVALENPLVAAAREEPGAAVKEGVGWVQLGGVRLKKKRT
ncbi:MAG: PQQ-binding-like beta-propeller repeat protein [Candidatus Eremiobacterota bacterium]